jgi:hypothetical protein
MRKSSVHWRALVLATVVWSANYPALAQPRYGIPEDATQTRDPKTGNITAGAPIEGFLKEQLTPLPPDAPKPSADPRNFEGVWLHDQVGVMRIEFDDDHKPVPFTEKGRLIRDRRIKSGQSGSPYINASLRCVPPGQPWELELNFPFRVFQTDKYMVFSFEEYHVVWSIRMSDHHKLDQPAQYMGDSIAHWEGNTLVVETTNYKTGYWIDGHGTPMSKNGRLIQRIRRIDDGGSPKLEITTTIDDKDMYAKPWSFARTFAWRPDRENFVEFNCERQAGAPDGISRYGAIPEPSEDQ